MAKRFLTLGELEQYQTVCEGDLLIFHSELYPKDENENILKVVGNEYTTPQNEIKEGKSGLVCTILRNGQVIHKIISTTEILRTASVTQTRGDQTTNKMQVLGSFSRDCFMKGTSVITDNPNFKTSGLVCKVVDEVQMEFAYKDKSKGTYTWAQWIVDYADDVHPTAPRESMRLTAPSIPMPMW